MEVAGARVVKLNAKVVFADPKLVLVVAGGVQLVCSVLDSVLGERVLDSGGAYLAAYAVRAIAAVVGPSVAAAVIVVDALPGSLNFQVPPNGQ